MKLVSICIPTNNRVELLEETITSIYGDGCAEDLFEICIADNSESNETKKLIEIKFSDKKNIVYSKNKSCGFLNSIEALRLGTGRLLKLHNDYSKFKKGCFALMLKAIENNYSDDTLMFFSMGRLKLKEKSTMTESFNKFLNAISYNATWSSAFSINKVDFDGFMCDSNIDMDKMFPHTSLLYLMTKKSKYYIDDNEYTEQLDVKKKGGYNIANNFSNIYLNMTKVLLRNKCITTNTYRKIERGIMRFLAYWKWKQSMNKEQYCFSFDECEQIIKENCGKHALLEYYFWVAGHFVAGLALNKK